MSDIYDNMPTNMAGFHETLQRLLHKAGVMQFTTIDIPIDHVDDITLGKGQGKSIGITEDGLFERIEIPNKQTQELYVTESSGTITDWKITDISSEDDIYHSTGMTRVENISLEKSFSIPPHKSAHVVKGLYLSRVTYENKIDK